MIAAGVGAVLTLGGCGSKDAGSAAAEGDGASADAGVAATASADPCSYLTAAEVTAITTDKVVETIREDDTCRYKSNPDDGMRVMIVTTDGLKQMDAVRGAAKLLGGIGQSVSGMGGAGADAAELLKEDQNAAPKLGDEAAWGVASMLSVRKGQAFVQITPPFIHDPADHPGYPIVKDAEKRQIAIKTAEKILAKL
ncbi:hypothetical protein ABC347_03725 [Sphingomonas sp. 1P06PA]|uniref:hypothetical protein n=1 Tax=Sphingomonas sp. 1P06PA TaxID=554121 RepID=UPI0039A6BB5F